MTLTTEEGRHLANLAGRGYTKALSRLLGELVDQGALDLNSAAKARFATVTALLADNKDKIGYSESGADTIVAAGDLVEVIDGQFAYSVRASDASDHHVVTAGGVKLDVLLNENGANIQAFGATGDGTTDDKSALQAAVDAVGDAGGGAVYIPEGTYKLTTPLSITDPNVTLIGDGPTASIILGSDPDEWVIKFGPNADYLRLANLWVKGSAADNTTTQYCLGYTSATDDPENVIVENCRFSHANNAIVVGSGKYWKICKNSFDTLVGINAGRGYGVLLAEANSHNIVSENTFVGTLTSHLRHAVYNSVGASYNIISNNVIKDCNEAAVSNYATSAQDGVRGINIHGNTIIGGGVAATTDAGTIVFNGNVQDCMASGNLIVNRLNAGITMTDAGESGNCSNNTAKGNSIIDVDLWGIRFIGTKNCTASGNYIHNASDGNSGTYAAIQMTSSGTFGTEVNDGSMIIGNTVTGSNHRNAFQINGAAPVSTNLYVAHNVFRAGATTNRAVELNGTPNYVNNVTDNIYTYGTNDIVDTRSRVSALNFGSISAGATAELTMSITGVTTTGWSVVATPTAALNAGLMWTAYVSATNTVTVRVANVTGSPIDPASTTFVVDCFRHNV